MEGIFSTFQHFIKSWFFLFFFSSSTANGGPPNPNPQRRRSSKSGGGIYLRLMNAASRSRKDSLSSITSVMAEDSIRSQADIDSDLKLIYG